MGNVEKKLTMRAMFGWLLFISYPFCGHAGILKVSLSFLPVCTVFWATKTYLTDSYFSSRPLKKWLHSGWYRTVLRLFMRRKRNIPTCVTFFHLESKVLKYSVLNVKISFQVPCFKASILSPDLRQSLYIVGLASRQDALKLCNICFKWLFVAIPEQ